MPKLLLTCAFLVVGLTANLQADEPVLLRYKGVKGDKTFYRTVAEQKQTMTVNDTKFDITGTTEDISSRTVEEVDGDQLRFKIKNERLKAKSKMGPIGEFTFDSRSTERDKGSGIGAML